MSVQGGQGGWQNGVGTASPIRGGSGGLCSLRGGAGGTPGTSNSADGGFGGRAFVAAGQGGNSPFGNTGTAGDGGDLELFGGSAGIALGGTGTHGNGGDAYLRGGDRLSGTGNNGSIFIADAHTAAITIGNATDNPPTSFLGTGAVTFGGHQALVEQSGDPGATANQGKFYTKDDSGVTQLFYRDSGGTVYQLTPTGQASSTSVQSASVYTCPAGLVVGDAVQITGADAVDKADASVPADRPVVGFVKSKPTATTCILHYYGELSAFGGLSVGSTYYLSDSTPGARQHRSGDRLRSQLDDSRGLHRPGLHDALGDTHGAVQVPWRASAARPGRLVRPHAVGQGAQEGRHRDGAVQGGRLSGRCRDH
jgi:hypothetical protein